MGIHHNLVLHTGWDLMQVANMDGADIAHDLRFHRNMVMDVGANAAIVMGSGDLTLDSNWFSGVRSDQALFIDNRTFVDTGAPIVVRGNFWQSDSVPRLWSVHNEHGNALLEGNHLAPDTTLIRYASGAGPTNVVLEANTFGTPAPLVFADTARGDWRLAANSPYAAWNLGLGTAEASSVRRAISSPGKPGRFGEFGLSPGGMPLVLPNPQGRRGR